MAETLDKNIRISTRVKYALDEMRGTKSCNELIEQMINYFEVTGYNPKRPHVDSLQKIDRRIEDLIKIVKCQEKDIFRPLLEKNYYSFSNQDNEQLIRLANENKLLKEQIQKSKDSEMISPEYSGKYKSLVDLIILFCNKSQFKRSSVGNDLLVPESFFDKLLEKINNEYVL